MSGSEESSEPPTKKLKSEGGDRTPTIFMAGPDGAPLLPGHSGLPLTSLSSGYPKPVIPATSGNIRPSLNLNSTTTNDSIQSRPQVHMSSPTIAIPVQQNWSTDGKVTLQFQTSTANKTTQPKSPVSHGNVIFSSIGTRLSTPQVVTIHNNRLTSPTSMLSKPVVSTDLKGQYPVTTKQGSGSEPVKMGQSTQISFQVPVNWNVAGSKSLLDSSGKMSVVAFNPSEGKSLLPDKKTVTSDSAPPQAGGSVSESQSMVTVVKTDNLSKSVMGGGKVITPGQIITSTMVPRNTSAINTSSMPPKITKQGSFVISKKQYTIVPASSSQVLKTDNKLNKAKITMAEAQIMLPTGPAKISWPIQQQQMCSTLSESGNKQILITAPLMKSGSLPAGKSVITTKTVAASNSPLTTIQIPKMAAMSSNLVPTAKVVDASSPGKSIGAGTSKAMESNHSSVNNNNNNNSNINTIRPATPAKTTVLPVQKNWEIVKQSSQLLPQNRTDKTPTSLSAEVKVETTQQSGSEADSNKPTDTIIHMICKGGGQSLLSGEDIKQESEEQTDSGQNGSEEHSSSKVENSGKNKSETTLGNSTREITITQPGSNKRAIRETFIAPQQVITKLDTKITEEKMEVEDTASVLADLKPEVANDKGGTKAGREDFDPVSALDWKDGIGELPGSNLKFRMNDGVLDVIADDLECTETLNTSNESETAEPDYNKMDITDETVVKQEPLDDQSDDEDEAAKQGSSQEVSNKDEITQCENCGEYGFTTDFYKEGRFCSQTCVGAFDSKRMRGVKKHGTMSKMVLGLKKGRKKILLKDSLNREDRPDMLSSVPATKKSKAFVWTRYLEQENATEAPARLFRNPFPSSKNNFRVGMKLEGVDPNHQSLFCVLSVVEVCGYRIRLHFDGYSECYDFWSDIDSAYIYPMGFCEKHNKVLQPPKGFAVDNFQWGSYLKLTKSTPAMKSLFSNQPVQPVTPNLFRVGSKLEAVDKKNSSLICVASVADTLGDKVLIHFDSWEDNYDYWCDMTSPFLHPCGFCDENGYVLSPPIDWKDPSGYTWEKYLAKSKSQAVPARAFKSRPMIGFEPGMKVEVVDKRNPLLVRVATIDEVENYMVKIHFDGWTILYDYWLDDDSPDIHPPGWCAKTGHPLVPPIGPSDLVVTSGPGVCPTPGCKGIGHIKGPKYSGHHSTFGCPYSEINMNKESVLGDRLASYIKSEDGGAPTQYRVEESTDKRSSTSYTDSNYTGAKSTTQQKLVSYNKAQDGVVHVPPRKFGRGRRPKSYYLELEEQRRAQEKEQERQEKEEALRQGIHNSVFSSAMVPTPKTEVPLCWDQHSKLLPGVTSISGNNVGRWSIDQVASFVNTLPGCEEQAKLFQEQQIDGEAFLLLTQTDIVKIMNIKLGPALKIFNSIIMFKNSVEV